MRRRTIGVGPSERTRHALAVLAFAGLVLSAGGAFAQTAPPPVTTPPATATPPVTAPVPAAPPPAAGAPAGAPGLEAGDTAAPGAAPAQIENLDPMHTAPLAPAPGLASPLVAPVPPARRPAPFYRKEWFWGAVAVVVVTGIVVSVLVLGTGDPATPATKLGDMNAF